MENRQGPMVGLYAVDFLDRKYLKFRQEIICCIEAQQKLYLLVLEIVSFPTLALDTCPLFFLLLLCWETMLAVAISESEAKCKIIPPPFSLCANRNTGWRREDRIGAPVQLLLHFCTICSDLGNIFFQLSDFSNPTELFINNAFLFQSSHVYWRVLKASLIISIQRKALKKKQSPSSQLHTIKVRKVCLTAASCKEINHPLYCFSNLGESTKSSEYAINAPCEMKRAHLLVCISSSLYLI